MSRLLIKTATAFPEGIQRARLQNQNINLSFLTTSNKSIHFLLEGQIVLRRKYCTARAPTVQLVDQQTPPSSFTSLFSRYYREPVISRDNAFDHVLGLRCLAY